VTFALFDDPKNPRSPADWFTMDSPFAYLTLTMGLDAEPFTLEEGKELRVHYGAAVLDGETGKEAIEAAYRSWLDPRAMEPGNGVPIVPIPVSARRAEGPAYRASPAASIVCAGEGAEVQAVAERAVESLRRVAGWTLEIDPAAGARGNIALRLDGGLFPGLPDWQRDEGYRLTAGAAGVEVTARAAHGLFNGVQSLAQLVTRSAAGEGQIPACAIEDSPRFPWRGLLLDPARHFLPIESLKKFVEVMATFKYNRLQLHLTDDQGWRLEIKKYPRLTQIGAVRKQSPRRGDRDHGDGAIYGPFFYTQDQIRDLVAFAAARQVTIVPEFEIPGHFGAAIAAHPELSCSGKLSEVSTPWGMNPGILCPGSDAAVAFARDVLAEICEVFPGKFIHIGGDEVPRELWKTCPKCQARMKSEGLKNEAELQTWLNHRLEEFLDQKGRRMIGWDEILDGGLTPGAVVMSWRGTQGGITAARAGHDVVMSPTSHVYFDYAQARGPAEPECIGGFVPLETVYSFEPMPEALPADRRRHILGGQGNLWGEYLWDLKDVEYFAFPRALALAEVLWSPADGRDLAGFLGRLDGQLAALERWGVNHRKLNPRP
jgi:hexosaminidase